MDFQHIIEAVGRYMDVAGVAVMVIGAVVSIPMALRGYQPRRVPSRLEKLTVYRSYRQLLGRSILLGLELLVAADIITHRRRDTHLRKRRRARDHRADPNLPELLSRAGNHRTLAMAERAVLSAGASGRVSLFPSSLRQ